MKLSRRMAMVLSFLFFFFFPNFIPFLPFYASFLSFSTLFSVFSPLLCFTFLLRLPHSFHPSSIIPSPRTVIYLHFYPCHCYPFWQDHCPSALFFPLFCSLVRIFSFFFSFLLFRTFVFSLLFLTLPPVTVLAQSRAGKQEQRRRQKEKKNPG